MCSCPGDTAGESRAMAKRGGSGKSSFGVKRGAFATATYSPVLHPNLSQIQDRRVWHPLGSTRPARTLSGAIPRIVVDDRSLTLGTPLARVHVHRRPVVARSFWTKSPRGLQVPVGVMYESPLNVLTCIRRKARRQVLFAKDRVLGRKPRQRSGRGGRHHRTWQSEIHC